MTAPVDGVVLKRLRESETFVPAGDPLIEIGDQAKLEIVADLLSDGRRSREGRRPRVRRAMGRRAAAGGAVRRIEPAGFMKISALGVEEQRVNVVLDFVEPASRGARVAGRRLSRRGPRRHLGIRRRPEGADERAVPPGRGMGGVCHGGRPRAGKAPGHWAPDRAGRRSRVGASGRSARDCSSRGHDYGRGTGKRWQAVRTA